MAPHETDNKLDAILAGLGELRTELLGSADRAIEKPTGRLPRLEAQSERHGRRITRLERIVYAGLGAFGLLQLLIKYGFVKGH